MFKNKLGFTNFKAKNRTQNGIRQRAAKNNLG